MDDFEAVFQQRRQNMLSEKINVSDFLFWFFTNYPESVREMKESEDYQLNFQSSFRTKATVNKSAYIG